MKKYLPVILSAGILLCACQSERTAPVVPALEPEEDVVNTTSMEPGELVVEFSDEMTAMLERDLQDGFFLQTRSESVNSMLASIGAVSVERLYPDAGEWEPRHREAGLHKWYRIKFDPEVPQTKAVRDFGEIPGIVFAEPVRKVRQAAIFNDPYLPKQWHYINDGSLTDKHKAGCDINVEPVWSIFTGGRKDVIVAVVDGGVDFTHEDLAAIVLPAGANGSKNFVRNSYQISAESHGTHVAGTIGAINNNGVGCCGVAGGLDGNGGVSIMSCQVFETDPNDPDVSLSGGFPDALVWAADHGAVIANNSWGYVYNSEEEALAGGVGSVGSAIDYFIKYAGTDKNGNQTGPMKGGVVVFSAGNESWKMGWPAADPRCIAVGAVAPDYTRASYSNYGDWVDIAAPGGSVQYASGEILSTVPGNKYTSYQGTSMACPHVAGIAALLVSQFGGPGFTNEMLKDRLLGGANPSALSRNAQIGPLADALGAFSYGSVDPPVAPSSHTVSVKSNTLTYKWKVCRDPDDKVAYGYVLLASEDESLLQDIDFKNIPAGVSYTTVMGGDLKAGQDIEGELGALKFSTVYYTSVVAFDYSKNYSGLSPVKSVTTGINNPPEIRTDHQGELVLQPFESASVDFYISDPDGHSFSISLVPGSDAVSGVQMLDSYKVLLNAVAADAGTYTAVITATDAFGMSSSYSLKYQILPNNPPQIKGNFENLIFDNIAERKAIELDDYIYDPDGETLSYSISCTPVGIVHLNPVDGVLNLTTLDYGLASVIITGEDAKGEKASVDLRVLVRDPASEPDVYPSQVVDKLKISDGEEKSLSVTISNSTGAVLYKVTQTCDAFNPIEVDMSLWAPGRYSVGVTGGNKDVKRTIVKI